MKTNTVDAIRLSPEKQAFLRVMIIRQYEKGKTPNEIMDILDLKPRLVYLTLRKYRLGGEEAIALKTMGRPQRSNNILTPEQEERIQHEVKTSTPNAHKLDGFLWDMRNLIALIALLFAINVKRSTLAVYTKRWGYSPQRPIIYNRKQNPQEVKEWLEITYPAIKARAKAENAEIYWCDEVGVQNKCNQQVGYASKGKTPVTRLSSDHKIRVNMISAINNQGKLRFMTYDQTMTQQLLIVFMKRLIKSTDRKVFLILDNLKVHHGKAILQPWLDANKDKIAVFYLPSYSPELNPDEYFNGTLKRTLEQCGDSVNLKKFKKNVHKTAVKIQQNQDVIANFFKAPDMTYAA
ncbi:MAG: IS630 family transposase [Rickettsiales bacterium]|jgi:transposase|nr:IS630 family transposase [Rickettsiales bacterium]